MSWPALVSFYIGHLENIAAVRHPLSLVLFARAEVFIRSRALVRIASNSSPSHESPNEQDRLTMGRPGDSTGVGAVSAGFPRPPRVRGGGPGGQSLPVNPLSGPIRPIVSLSARLSSVSVWHETGRACLACLLALVFCCRCVRSCTNAGCLSVRVLIRGPVVCGSSLTCCSRALDSRAPLGLLCRLPLSWR